jgi:predicted nucleotidyltransferase
MDNVINRLKEHYQAVLDMGYETIGIFLQGSQNYNLEYEGSDIDTKVIVLPKFEDFVLGNKMVSYTHIMENEEHVDIKDIRLMFECFRKQNINFVEILFTKYKILNPKYESLFKPMLDNNELIGRYNNYASVNCISGACMEKRKALEHPYPSIISKIEKYGYDPKQLSTIIRLNEFIKRYLSGEPYHSCLISNQRDFIIDVKKGCLDLEKARELANKLTNETLDIKNDYIHNNKPLINTKCEEIMDNVLLNVMKYNFQTEMDVWL